MILEVNRTGAAMLGSNPEALANKPLSSFVCKDNYATYYSHLRQVLGTKTRRTCEIRLERYDGYRFHTLFESIPVRDLGGRFTRCRTVISDISELKRAEEALRESEELHRVTLSSISDTVLITDHTGMFTYVCPNVHVIFGYSQEEVKGLRTVDRLLGAGFFDPCLLDGREEVENIERRIADKAGMQHVLLVNIKRVSIKGGTFLFSCRDITALKKAQEALHRNQSPMP
jgi:PAS domain S-box-containing protein